MIEEKLEDIKCELCGTQITEEIVEYNDTFKDDLCNCEIFKKIIGLQVKIRKTKEQIRDLIYKKTDGELFSELSKSDLEDLNRILE